MSDDQCNITLLEHVVFQPKEPVWMTEVDLASHENKQYMRKSYQSTMEFTKERQLEADVVETSDVNIELGSRSEITAKWQKNAKGESDEKSGINISSRDNTDSKVPPQKPPRKTNAGASLSKGGQKNVEVVAITSNTRAPIGEVRCLGGIPDTPSVLVAGSRLSSFAPASSFRSGKGHSRSKSESLKAEQLSAPVIVNDNLKNSKGQLLVSEEIVSGCIVEQRSTSPTSPRKPLLSPKPRSKSSVGSKSPGSRGDRKFQTLTKTPQSSSGKPDQVEQEKLIKQEDVVTAVGHSKYGKVKKELDLIVKMPPSGTLTLHLNEKEKGHIVHDGSEVERNEANHIDEQGRRSPFANEQFEKMLKELSSRSTMFAAAAERRSVMGSSVDSPAPLSGLSSQSSDDAGSGGGKEKTLFFPSNLQVPSLKISHPNETAIPCSSMKPLHDVRKSTFFSHDEESSLLEDKSLLLDYQSNGNLRFPEVIRSDMGLRDTDPISPSALSPDSCSDTQSDQDESVYSDDTESSPSLLNIKSEHYRARHASLESEKWLATNTEDGKIYFYEESGSKSQWKLTEHDECDDSYDGKEKANRPTSPNESLRISLLQENLNEFSNNIEKEGFLHRTFIMRDGKKCRKNWTQSYVRYIIGQFNTGSSGLLHFSKNKDDDKKAELFEFYDVCHLERTNDKKTSRQQVLGLRNGRDTEVLLQFDDKDIADEWLKILASHEGMKYDVTPLPEKEDKKGKKGSDKVKRETSMDNLNADNKGITDKLRSFIKRRPLKETLEKKGIYKEAVFGSTLAELASQDKTGIPIFVLQCINHIEKSEENLRTDGLYRISGNAAQIQKIRYEVAQRNYSILSREKDVHNLAGSLKLFFRELKEPVIPYANYVDFIQATGSEFRRMNQQAEKLIKAVRKLPSENYETLKVLLQHLLRVTEFESDNRMSVSNLAIVFGPCLLWPKETTSSDLMTDVMLHNRVIEGLLTDFPKVFNSKR